MSSLSYPFMIGTMECTAVSDGTLFPNARTLFANAPDDLLTQALQQRHLEPDYIPTALNCLLIRHHHQTILIDTGRGAGVPHAGQLLDHLRGAGVDSHDVDMVILSHAHLDHIGGAVTAAGEPAFPRARYILSQTEWDFWHSDTSSAAGEDRGAPIRQRLRALQPQLDLIPEETTLLAGLITLPAPGHTPGQLAVQLSSQGEKLLYTGDTIAHPLHLHYPQWNTLFDLDPEQTLRTRRTLLDRAADEHMLVFVYHFPFPGVYRLAREAQGWHAVAAADLSTR